MFGNIPLLLFPLSFPDVMMFNLLNFITMETKENLTPKRNRLLSYQWDLNSQGYKNIISFLWQKNSIRVDIHSICKPPGKDKSIHFDFYINGKHSLYTFGYNCYGGGHSGEIPKVQTEDYKLDIVAGPFSIEIYEEEIKKCQILNTAISVPVMSLSGEKKEDYFTRLERLVLEDRKKEVWFSVSKDNREINKYVTPFEDDQLWFWIKRTFSKQYSSDVLLFEYQLFAPTLKPLFSTTEGFICQRIFDECKSIGCGTYSFISFEISDPTGHRRMLNWGGWNIEDIARTVSFIDSIRGYKHWKDYDSIQTLYKSSEVTVEQIHEHLGNELSGLGINREGENNQ